MGKNCPRNRFWNVLCQQPFFSVNYMELMERRASEYLEGGFEIETFEIE